MEHTFSIDGPLDAPRTLARYALWGQDPANVLTGDVFRRAVKVDGQWRIVATTFRAHCEVVGRDGGHGAPANR